MERETILLDNGIWSSPQDILREFLIKISDRTLVTTPAILLEFIGIPFEKILPRGVGTQEIKQLKEMICSDYRVNASIDIFNEASSYIQFFCAKFQQYRDAIEEALTKDLIQRHLERKLRGLENQDLPLGIIETYVNRIKLLDIKELHVRLALDRLQCWPWTSPQMKSITNCLIGPLAKIAAESKIENFSLVRFSQGVMLSRKEEVREQIKKGRQVAAIGLDEVEHYYSRFKTRSTSDLADCDIIHLALKGAKVKSGAGINIKCVTCYTMDNLEVLSRRVSLYKGCLAFLERWSSEQKSSGQLVFLNSNLKSIDCLVIKDDSRCPEFSLFI